MSGFRDSNSVALPTSDADLSKPKKKWNYKKIGLITAGVVVAVIIITVLVVVLVDDSEDETTTLTPTTPNEVNDISLDDFLYGRLSTRRFSSRWITGEDVLGNNANGLVQVNVLTDEFKVLLEPNDLLAKASTYSLSPDNKYVIIGYDRVKGFRHSFDASYSVYALDSNDALSKAAPIKIFINDENDKLTLVQWNPTGVGLAIIYKNNIYYKPNLDADPIQITADGDLTYIFNGIPDWVYEEEVFGSNSAMRFSPDGNRMAYIRFDDTLVKTFEYTFYGEPGTTEAQYPTNMQVSYPKVGTTNPTVQLYHVDLGTLPTSGSSSVLIEVPTQLSGEEHIISTLSWANNDQVVATWMNRKQNKAYIQISNVVSAATPTLVSLDSTGGWLELFTNPLYNGDGSRFALILSNDQGGDAGGYRHLTVVDTNTGSEMILTKGKYVVTQLINWDEDDYIFYSANTEDSRVLHIYAIKAELDAESQCLTCNIEAFTGDYSYFSASFTNNGKLFGLNALGPDVPRADIFSYSATDNKINLKHERVWETNDALKQRISNLNTRFPTIEYGSIKLTSGYDAQLSMILPGDIDRSGTTKYPVLINVYGGPDSYSVTNQWGTNWGTYLAAAKDIIYVRIDGRGSGLRGDKLMHEIYLKLGTVEIEDQIETASLLAKEYSFIDGDRIAIWGWSYGGYAAGLALAKDTKNVFKCAVSVAPVTDWTYYDTIYTERYMGLLEENAAGYATSRLSTLYEGFKGKNYFLIHGNLDDNVHYQQAMALSRSLETNAILFKQMSYPDEDHSLSGVQPHLYNTLERYFNDCFQLEQK